MARLIVDEKDFGQHFFLVRLRRQDDHSLLPGVETGHVGPKHGFHLKDNGYASFNRVRIPRMNMLMRYSSLDRDGHYSQRGNPKILYITMLEGRLWLFGTAT